MHVSAGFDPVSKHGTLRRAVHRWPGTSSGYVCVRVSSGHDHMWIDLLRPGAGVRRRCVLHESTHLPVELRMLPGVQVRGSRKGRRNVRAVHESAALQDRERVLLGLHMRSGRLLRADHLKRAE